ncbi:hypothetical protein [Chromobacterium vaccinii]|uniref:hypothetical protein n=1 Tax=Chromobacterium vaccinii TaxID=1108595 RepID=UPI00345A15AD
MNISVFLDRPIAFHRAFKALTRDTNASLLLSQLLYWHNRVEEDRFGDRWFYKTQIELEDETGLSRAEQETARAKLRELGVLSEVRKGVPARLFFRVDCDRLTDLCEALPQTRVRQSGRQVCGNQAIQYAATKQTSMRGSGKQDGGNVASKSAASQQSLKGTETTTEITTETTLFPAPLSGAPVAAGAGAKVRKAAGNPLAAETWAAYAEAYRQRYGVDPVRNATVNGQIANFVKRLGENAPHVAAYFVGSASAFYVSKGHAVGVMLCDAEKLHTEWATGRRVTQSAARQADRTASNFANAQEALAMLDAEMGGRQ